MYSNTFRRKSTQFPDTPIDIGLSPDSIIKAATVLDVCIIILCHDDYFITYLVPLPLPSIFTTPFFPISFSNWVVFDLPNGA